MFRSGGGHWEQDRASWHLARWPTSRRLRVHGLIQRLPHSNSYQVTDNGLGPAMFLAAVHDRLLPTGLARLTNDQPTALRTAAGAYRTAIDDLTRTTRLAA